MTDDLRVHQDGAILHVLLDRPSRRNAMHLAMYTAFTEALRRAAADDGVRVVTVRGAGEHFTAGNDIADFVSNPPLSEDHPIFHFLRTVIDFPKPLIAGVDGAAVGIGTTLLLHCDLVVASEGARFQLPFVPLGLVPEAASTVLLPAIVGRQRAMRWVMLGEPFDAAEALAAGLISCVVPREQLADRVDGLATRLAALPPDAVRSTKALMKAPLQASVWQALADESRAFTERLQSPEAAAAFATFLSRKR